jgi:hypothetical protein
VADTVKNDLEEMVRVLHRVEREKKLLDRLEAKVRQKLRKLEKNNAKEFAGAG